MRKLAAPALVLLTLLAGCALDDAGGSAKPKAEPTGTPASLMLDFESAPPVGQDLEEVDNEGTSAVEVAVDTSDDANLEVVEGPGGGHAARFPAYTGADPSPEAVIVASAKETVALDPLDQDFRFGASFILDATSSGSKGDNGDNLVQRGSFDSPGQFKIQIDHKVPSCRILGDDGEVFVKAGTAISPEVWYSVTCQRTGSEVSISVTQYGERGQTWTAAGPTGHLTLGDLPLAVGGKVSPEGVPVASGDQFNGSVDDVFLQIG
jgi:hypothetical protein